MSSQKEQSSVLVIDQMPLRRAALTRFLQGWADEQCVKLVELTGSEPDLTAERVGDCKMIIVDIGTTSLIGETAIPALPGFSKDIPVVIISERDKCEEVCAAIELGARSYLPYSTEPDTALAALTFILRGGSAFPRVGGSLAGVLFSDRNKGERCGLAESSLTRGVNCEANASVLTTRQQQVTELLVRGLPNKQIARQLDMTEATVKVHVRQIMRKLGASNRTQAALSAAGRQDLPVSQGH